MTVIYLCIHICISLKVTTQSTHTLAGWSCPGGTRVDCGVPATTLRLLVDGGICLSWLPVHVPMCVSIRSAPATCDDDDVCPEIANTHRKSRHAHRFCAPCARITNTTRILLSRALSFSLSVALLICVSHKQTQNARMRMLLFLCEFVRAIALLRIYRFMRLAYTAHSYLYRKLIKCGRAILSVRQYAKYARQFVCVCVCVHLTIELE